MWTALATIAAALIGGMATYFGTKKTNQTSQEISSNNIQFQQAENEITRYREDTAHQRAVADMEAAGLSKTLAAGSPASAAALTAPQDTREYQNPMQKAMEKMNLKQTVMDLASLKADVDMKKAQEDYIKAQTAGQLLSNQTFMENFNNEQTAKLASVDVMKAQIRSYDAQTMLNNKIGQYKTQELVADINYKLAQTESLKKGIALTDAQIDKITAEIIKMTSEKYKLDQEGKLLVQDIINAEIKGKQMQHDYDYAVAQGLPVGTVPGSVLGVSPTGIQGFYNMLMGNLFNNPNSSFQFIPQGSNFGDMRQYEGGKIPMYI